MLSRQFSNLKNVEIKYKNQYKDHDLGIEKILFLKDSNNFITSSHDKTIKLWSLDKKKPLATINNIHKEGIWDFDYYKKKGIIISVSPDSNIQMTELKSKKVIKTIKTDMMKGYTIKISEDEKYFLAGGQYGSIYLCNINGKTLKTKEFKNIIIYNIQNMKENWILSTSDGRLIFLDNNLEVIFEKKISDNEILTFGIFKNDIFVSTNNNNIEHFVIDLKNKKIESIKSCEGHADKITSFLIDEKNNFLFTGSNDGSIFAWDLEGFEYKHNLIGHLERISGMDLNDNNLITASWDQTCLSFDLLNIEK